jgi:predicted DNA-binding transcriptional regulator AlpA
MSSSGKASRWARNKQLAQHAGVSVMQIWRWKQLPDFPKAAVLGGIEYNDVHLFDQWMASHTARRNTEPTRGQRAAAKNFRRKNVAEATAI